MAEFSKQQLEQLQQQSRGGKIIEAGTVARASGAGIAGETAARLGAAYEQGKKNLQDKYLKSWNLGTDAPTTGVAKGLRILGYRGAADFWDKFRAVDKKAVADIKAGKTKSGKSKKTTDDDSSESAVASEIETITGSLVRIENRMGLLATAIIDVGSDVSSIKKMLSPQSFIAEYASGDKKKFTFNPLAPSDDQFMWKGEGGSLSKVDNKKAVEALAEAVAKHTTELSLKQKEEDDRKAELRLKREQHIKKYVDPEERRANNPLAQFRKETNANFEKLFKMLKGGGNAGATTESTGSKLGWVASVLNFFALWGPKLMRFLKPMIRLFGRMSAVGLAAWLGYEIGSWIWDNYGTEIMDGIFAIKDWWNSLDLAKEWDSLKGVVLGIPGKIKGVITEWWDDIILLLNDKLNVFEDKAAAIRAKRADQAAALDQQRDYRKEAIRNMANSSSNEELHSQEKLLRSMLDDPKNRYSPMRKLWESQLYNVGQAINYKNSRGTIQRTKSVKQVITDAAGQVGVNPALMLAVGKVESNFDPNAKAKTSSALGLFQFTEGTWGLMMRRYGRGQYADTLAKGPTDPDASAVAAALLMKEHIDILRANGIQVSASKLYTMHFMGAGQAKKLFESDPKAIAAELFPDEQAANKEIFFKEQGKGRARTVQEVQDLLSGKIDPYVDTFAAELNMPTRVNGREVETDSMAVDIGRTGGAGGKEYIPVPVPVASASRAQPPMAAILAKAGSNTNDRSLLGNALRDNPHPYS